VIEPRQDYLTADQRAAFSEVLGEKSLNSESEEPAPETPKKGKK
jgi:hypothetical protein